MENLRTNNSRSLFSRVLVFIWGVSVVFVCYLSLAPVIEFPLEFRWGDKVYHALAYLWLSVLPFFGFDRHRTALTCSFMMFPLGVGMEFAQYFVPGRVFSVSDMMANGTGAVLGILIGRKLKFLYYRATERFI